MKLFFDVLNAVTRAGIVLAAICIGVTAVSYAVEVVARYGLSSPLNWSGDVGSYMLCVSVFLALPQIARNRGHVTISILADMLPVAWRRPHMRLLFLVTAVVLIIVSWFVAQVSLTQFQRGVLTPMTNQIPRWWLTSIMAVSLLVSALHFLFPQTPMSSAIHPEV